MTRLLQQALVNTEVSWKQSCCMSKSIKSPSAEEGVQMSLSTMQANQIRRSH